jgi:hypothetical protein
VFIFDFLPIPDPGSRGKKGPGSRSTTLPETTKNKVEVSFTSQSIEKFLEYYVRFVALLLVKKPATFGFEFQQ